MIIVSDALNKMVLCYSFFDRAAAKRLDQHADVYAHWRAAWKDVSWANTESVWCVSIVLVSEACVFDADRFCVY